MKKKILLDSGNVKTIMFYSKEFLFKKIAP